MGLLSKIFGLSPKKLPLRIDDANFDREVMKSELPVILDVWGPNCRPCQQFEPILMQLAADYDGRVKVCEMNTLVGMESAARLKVRGTPTVLYLKRGREVERVVGLRGSLYHEQTIEELFGIPKKPE